MTNTKTAPLEAAPVVQPPHLDVRKPLLLLPQNACDSHAHVCGTLDRYPCIPERVYTPPPEGTLKNYRALLATLGVQRAVLVQPSFYADDNTAVLDGLKVMGRNARGVVVLRDDVSAAELERLHEAGARGVRFNIVDLKTGKGMLPIERLRRMAERVAPFGWHVELLMHVNEFPDMDRTFADFPVPIVVGHLGYVPRISASASQASRR